MNQESRERAILVGVALKGAPSPVAPTGDAKPEECLEELATLAQSAGAEVVDRTVQVRSALDPATLVGSGKVEELASTASAVEADLVLFDRDLTPTQLRNLEAALPARIIDRTQLILDIFARRARTREGQLQVELAQLNYLLPRLTGRGVEMSRLGGGIGTRGPGETQLETDRRRIFRRIRKIEEQLDAVRKTRGVQRSRRQGVPMATVTMVGYTNAGKSTLFNRLTGAGVTADARMFATLDATLRVLSLPSRRRVILGDTVGFIRNLPTTLVRAFRATLEEVKEASLLLHVIDVSSSTAAEQTRHVHEVLSEIGAAAIPQVLVFSKADLVEDELDPYLLANRVLGHANSSTAVSARTGHGIEDLLDLIDHLLPVDPVRTAKFRIPASEGHPIHLLHEFARIREKRYDSEWCLIQADAPESLLRQLDRYLMD